MDQALDTTAAIEQAMKQMKHAMKDMPERHKYMRRYDDLRRQVATLLMLLDDGSQFFCESSKIAKSQKQTAKHIKQAGKVKAA